ncbi:MAG: DUF429 domain-containing protein [Chloroflexota bacterium]|nr:DUF429 domain-containing protein [Chloroflexota bacterium]
MIVVGVDGCPGGWVAMEYDSTARTLSPRVFTTFEGLLAAHRDVACIGVDIPIGLIAGEPRRCDVEARRVLGARRSSVFPAPDPRIVGVGTYVEALERSRALTGKGISKQSHAIYPKVAEVDRLMAPESQRRVVEVHPEVSFWALSGRPMSHSKKVPAGFEERRGLLVSALETIIPDRDTARTLARPAAADDVLDAIVAAWTALRFATGIAGRLPTEPQLDARGLRAEIVY